MHLKVILSILSGFILLRQRADAIFQTQASGHRDSSPIAPGRQSLAPAAVASSINSASRCETYESSIQQRRKQAVRTSNKFKRPETLGFPLGSCKTTGWRVSWRHGAVQKDTLPSSCGLHQGAEGMRHVGTCVLVFSSLVMVAVAHDDPVVANNMPVRPKLATDQHCVKFPLVHCGGLRLQGGSAMFDT
jgi:hypothetical protein